MLNDLSRLSAIHHINCPFSNMLAICPNGDVTLCACYGEARGLYFGNVKSDSIEDIWLTNEQLAEIRDGLPRKLEGICAVCFFKGVCRGSCRAEALRVFGSYFKPHPMCEYLRQVNRFPQRYIIGQ